MFGKSADIKGRFKQITNRPQIGHFKIHPQVENLHFGKHIAHNLAVIVCYIQKLWPRQYVVQVVLQGKIGS